MSWNEIPANHWLDTENLVIDAGYYLRTSVAAGNPLGLDVESTGLNTTKDVPILISFSDGLERFTGYFDLVARNNWIESLLLDPAVIKVGTNIKFDRHMCANANVHMVGPFRDTVVMDWLYNENRWGHGLKETALDHLGLQMREFKEVFPMRKARKGMPAETAGEAINRIMADPATAEDAKEYSGTDPYASVLVHNFLALELQKIQMLPGQNMWEYFLNVEVPFTDVLWNLERRGFKIHAGQLLAQVGPITQTMTQLQGELSQMAGWIVNPNSVPQLQKLFYEQLQMPVFKMTKGGKSGVKKPSTDDEVLGTWIGTADPVAAPFAERILGYREVSKIKGTYIDGLTERMDSNLRIHSTLNHSGTVTGRISSSDPNLQNIPRPATDKFKLRSSFIAEPGMRLVVLDYDQLEMKLMAHFSGDEKMVQAINNGQDLHCFSVSLMFGENYDEVLAAKKSKKPDDRQQMLRDKRQASKSAGFGVIYGIGADALAKQLTVELKRKMLRDEAQGILRSYFDSFQGVKEFIRQTKERCRQREYVETFLGRRRRLPEINARGGGDRQDDEINAKGVAAMAARQAVNSIIQGTAADIAKLAMIRAEYDPTLHDAGARLLLQIHDELIFEVPDSEDCIETVKKRAQEIMENPFGPVNPFQVKLTCEAKAALCWSEAK